MKKLFTTILTVLLVTALLAGCSAPEATAPAPEQVEESVPTASSEVTEPAHQVVEEADSPVSLEDAENGSQEAECFIPDIEYYTSIEDYSDEFGSGGKWDSAINSKINDNNLLIPYNDASFTFANCVVRPDLVNIEYCFNIIGKDKDFVCITYDLDEHWKELEDSMENEAEVIELDSTNFDKVLYDDCDDDMIDLYLVYINEEPVVVRFFFTPKEAALEILEGCEFVAPEEITK